MLRALIFLAMTPQPAQAWTFAPLPVCTLDHAEPQGAVRVTFDPGKGLYAIRLTRSGGWPSGPVLSIAFGGTGLTISTPRHNVAGGAVTVEDTGFGNVLAGLERGGTATATLGGATMAMDLTGAAEAVAAFRACPATGLV